MTPPSSPPTPVSSIINIHWGVVGGDLQRRQDFVLTQRWRIIYTDEQTRALRYSTPSQSLFIDLNLGCTDIYWDKNTECERRPFREAGETLTKLHVVHGCDRGVRLCPNKV